MYKLLLVAIAFTAGFVPARAEESLTYCQQGQQSEEIGLHKLALLRYTKCLNTGDLTEDSKATALIRRGTMHWYLDSHEPALEDYNSAVALGSEATEVYFFRGAVLEDLKRYDLAAADADKLVTLIPEDAEAWNARCWWRALAGRHEEALPDCEKALEIEPDAAHIVHSLAFTYEGLGDTDRAITEYKRALELDPELEEAKDDLARLEGALTSATDN